MSDTSEVTEEQILNLEIGDGLTDDEAIAMAMLLGCEFFENGFGYMFVNGTDPDEVGDAEHPLEAARRLAWIRADDRGEDNNLHWGWPSKAALAHDYIKWWREEQRR